MKYQLQNSDMLFKEEISELQIDSTIQYNKITDNLEIYEFVGKNDADHWSSQDCNKLIKEIEKFNDIKHEEKSETLSEFQDSNFIFQSFNFSTEIKKRPRLSLQSVQIPKLNQDSCDYNFSNDKNRSKYSQKTQITHHSDSKYQCYDCQGNFENCETCECTGYLQNTEIIIKLDQVMEMQLKLLDNFMTQNDLFQIDKFINWIQDKSYLNDDNKFNKINENSYNLDYLDKIQPTKESNINNYMCNGCQEIFSSDCIYHCKVCQDFDFCHQCFQQNSHEHRMHKLQLSSSQISNLSQSMLSLNENQLNYSAKIILSPSQKYEIRLIILEDHYEFNFELKNNGSTQWPEDLQLKCIKGIHENECYKIDSLMPGQQIKISLNLKSPQKQGQYINVWRLSYYNYKLYELSCSLKEQVFFGPRIQHISILENDKEFF